MFVRFSMKCQAQKICIFNQCIAAAHPVFFSEGILDKAQPLYVDLSTILGRRRPSDFDLFQNIGSKMKGARSQIMVLVKAIAFMSHNKLTKVLLVLKVLMTTSKF